MRRFSLRNPSFEIPPTAGLLFRWSGLPDVAVANQLAFQEQFLGFLRHLFVNLQSTPDEHPDWAPTPLSLSLRAGALKTYVLAAVSIVEGALAELGALRGLGKREALHKKPFGALLTTWEDNEATKAELAPLWNDLQLLKTYRNFVHLAKAAQAQEAYWQDIVAREAELLQACDQVIEALSEKSNGQ